MKKNIEKNEFISKMLSYYDGNGFSRNGLSVLFDYLLEIEDSTETDIEFDAVAFHCEFSEYNIEDLKNDYSYIIDEDVSDIDDIINLMNDCTTVLKIDDETVIIQEF